jgi:aminopeptidase-like protein
VKKFYNIGKNILFKINRSITGKGTTKTLKIIQKELPQLKIKKIASGTKVFDWTIPPEWNVIDAYVLDKNGLKIIDFKKNNLHLLGYSTPLKKTLTKKYLFKNLYFLKKQPKAIPYSTSYYKKNWGFCVSYEEFKKFDRNYSPKDKFKVNIESNFKARGNLNYGEVILKGKSKQEILISTYICHPSMANNELSGPIVAMGLIDYFSKKKINKTLRFIFIPETIGSISYLSMNLNHLKKNVIGGYNLSCIGDDKQHSCMFSKFENSPSDEAIIESYKKLKIKKYKIYSFLKRGSDERQYNSPGVDLRISSIFRTKYGEYPEYHTSQDDFNLVTLRGINGGYKVAKTAVEIMLNKTYPKYKFICEPQMSKKGLYPTRSTKNKNKLTSSYMNFLQYADGYHSLEKISKLIKIDLKSLKEINALLLKKHLISN